MKADAFPPKILLISDDPDKSRLLQHTLVSQGYSGLVCPVASQDAPRQFEELHPDLIIIDLFRCETNETDVVSTTRGHIQPEDFLPILVINTDDTPEARERALCSGGMDYLCEPFSPCELGVRVRNLATARGLHLQVITQRQELEERVDERTAQIQDAYQEAVYMLAKAGEFRDDDTGSHAQRVGDLAREIAFHLGLPDDQIAMIGQAALLHDLGKIGIPDAILLKPGKLTPQELVYMKKHAEIGAEILANSRSEIFRLAEIIALTHHERWDGTGYLGMEGNAIPIVGRIVAVADVFDALVHARPYKPAWSLSDAVDEITRLAGSAFDPRVVEAFLSVLSDRHGIIELEFGIAS